MKTAKQRNRQRDKAKRRQSRAQEHQTSRLNDVASLRTMAHDMLEQGRKDSALDMLMGVIETLHGENERLSVRLHNALIARFGRSSERLNPEELGQLVLALGGTEKEAAAPDPQVPVPEAPVEKEPPETSGSPQGGKPKKERPNHKGRGKLDPSLPRIITPVRVPDDERSCVHCGAEMQTVDHVDHEWVEYEPARIVVHVERREKVACKCCRQDIATAPHLPLCRLERRAGASLVAHLIESKVDDALPIHRQRDQFKRLGFDVPLNTLYGYWSYGTTLLLPVAKVTISAILAELIVGVDDTRLDYLDKDAPNGKRRGHLWCVAGNGPLVGFIFTETWKAEDIAPWLLSITGFVQCDDYGGYSSKVLNDEGRLVELVPADRRLGCLMHVRRYFHRAWKVGDVRAAVPLKYISDIYTIEARAKELALSPDDRLALRQTESRPLLDAFDRWVDGNIANLRPSSPLLTAAGYAQQQRPFVHRCFTDGRFEIDNGHVERQIREPAVGRRNYMFSGSADAAEGLAAAYTLVMSCRRLGISVREYLCDVLTKLASGWPLRRINDLRPDIWAASRGVGLTEQVTQQAKQ